MGAWQYVTAQVDLGLDLGFFGYPDHVHPIILANGALAVGNEDYAASLEFSAAPAWTGTVSDLFVAGGALYGTWEKYRAGLFVGRHEDTNIVRGTLSYEY